VRTPIRSGMLRRPNSGIMGEHKVREGFDDEQLRRFMVALLADVSALESMLDEGLFETGTRRIGAEQEMFLVDGEGRPVPKAMEILERLHDPGYTTELARFNLEANLSPRIFGGDCLSKLEDDLNSVVARALDAAKAEGCEVVLTGILPTLRQSDLGLENMTPNPRYFTLNSAMRALRGGNFDFRFKGVDELDTTHDNVMLESANTSFQIHFQVGHTEFAKLYNLAQAITGPVLAASVNSPLLLGKRLWAETRVGLFQQSVDARTQSDMARGRRPRVSFGDHWIKSSVLEIFREDIARFRVVLAIDADEDPQAVLARGEMPALSALRLHNGTVYRWNRPCYGVHDGKAHLRIENRALPAGPSVVDEVASAAFYFGLMAGLGEKCEDVSEVMLFDHAKANFIAAARHGLKGSMTWFDGKEFTAQQLILDELLPLADEGLRGAGIAVDDIDRYLGIVEERVRRGRTGAQWQLDSLNSMGDQAPEDQRLRTLTRALISRQRTGTPVHEWVPAHLDESGGWRQSYLKVGQFMGKDVFTVRPEDVVDLAASLMDWRHVRHVPVEDSEGRLVGLVSHRSLLRLVGKGLRTRGSASVAVRDIMKKNPVSVSPETPTLEAIEIMRRHRVGCLPVVDADRQLVGIITEADLIQVSAILFEQHLREASAE